METFYFVCCMFQLQAAGDCPPVCTVFHLKKNKQTFFLPFSVFHVDLLTSDEYSESISKSIQTYGKQAPHVCKVCVCVVSHHHINIYIIATQN